ncbi:MAG: FHA domain-containing protein, partial [Gammaproteobacteria bacterium]
MRILVRQLTRGAGDAVSVRERAFDDGFLSIGRATDQSLQVNDPRMQLQHAQVRASGNGFVLTCLAPAQAVVNDEVTRNARLAPGDVVLLGALKITVGEPPAPGELLLTVEQAAAEPPPEAEPAAPVLTLTAAGWRKRPWAWALFLVTGLGCLV